MTNDIYTNLALLIVGTAMVSIGIMLMVLRQLLENFGKTRQTFQCSALLLLIGMSMILLSMLAKHQKDEQLIALVTAVEQGDGHALGQLIQTHANLLEADVSDIGHGEPLVHRAIDTGKLPILIMTLSTSHPNMEIKDSHGRTPLIHALENHELMMVHVLLTRDASPLAVSPDGNTAIQLARSLGVEYMDKFRVYAPQVYEHHIQNQDNSSSLTSARN